MQKPSLKPKRPFFSSGPCAKPPHFHVENLKNAFLGRSHRAPEGKERLRQVLALTREMLNVPDDYQIALTPAGGTGAFELAMWNLLGTRPVDMVITDVFGQYWHQNLQELGLEKIEVLEAPFGECPDLKKLNIDYDCVCVWNGTTSSFVLKDTDFHENSAGLVLCDATSAAFAVPLPFKKLDAVTFSWQKVLGGEGGHGMIILSPKAIKHLENYTPKWPIPRLFRLKKEGKLLNAFFKASTLNTPSMLCVEDFYQNLLGAQKQGGANFLAQKAQENAQIVYHFLDASDVMKGIVHDQSYRSTTCVCFDFIEDWYQCLKHDEKWQVIKDFVKLLADEGVAYDIAGHSMEEPCIRVWTGPTVEKNDLERLMPWFLWAYHRVKK